MITSPSGSPSLTSEQTSQLEEYQGRLAVLQSEIRGHTHILVAKREESAALLKSVEYQKEQLASAEVDTSDAKAKLSEVQNRLVSERKQLESVTAESAAIAADNKRKKIEFDEREQSLQNREKDLTSRLDIFNEQSGKLTEDQKSVEAAKIILSKVIDSLPTWK